MPLLPPLLPLPTWEQASHDFCMTSSSQGIQVVLPISAITSSRICSGHRKRTGGQLRTALPRHGGTTTRKGGRRAGQGGAGSGRPSGELHYFNCQPTLPVTKSLTSSGRSTSEPIIK